MPKPLPPRALGTGAPVATLKMTDCSAAHLSDHSFCLVNMGHMPVPWLQGNMGKQVLGFYPRRWGLTEWGVPQLFRVWMTKENNKLHPQIPKG